MWRHTAAVEGLFYLNCQRELLLYSSPLAKRLATLAKQLNVAVSRLCVMNR